MDKIQVKVLSQGHGDPGGMMLFLARLTQRGHNIKNMTDLLNLYNNSMDVEPTHEADWIKKNDKRHELMRSIAALPHGTITRFAPITVAIVGASRRFLAQARTHQVGINYVSASLQYSDYTGQADFVVPYAILEADHNARQEGALGSERPLEDEYILSCESAMASYRAIAEATDNDTAGYAAPQGLRNILIMQANHESWQTFIQRRACNRNTVETQYVTCLIWHELLQSTKDGEDLFAMAGPDCVHGRCREGSKTCGHVLHGVINDITFKYPNVTAPRAIIEHKWPLVAKEVWG